MRPDIQKPRFNIGNLIDNRYLVHDIKMGGMGEVYLCLDLERGIPLALKTFQQKFLTNIKLRTAFKDEIANWIALGSHPNIVTCYWMENIENQPFMALEWVFGQEYVGTNLRGLLRYGPLDMKTCLEFALDICNGLSYARKMKPGLVHCDLKPENILLSQGSLAKITDFGLAQVNQKIVDKQDEDDLEDKYIGFEFQGSCEIAGTPSLYGSGAMAK